MYLETNNETFYKQVLKEFGKSKEDVEDYVRLLREWTDSLPHLPEKPSDKLLQYLLLCHKFRTEDTKQAIDMYYSLRTLIPELFSHTPFSEEMKKQFVESQMLSLPKLDDQYRRILYYRMHPDFTDPIYYNQAAEMSSFVLLLEYLLLEDTSFRLHLVCDMQGKKMGHISKFSPMLLKKTILILEKIFSTNLGSICLVNIPPFMEVVINNLVKPMLKPKIQNKIKISSTTDILLQEFGKELLPKDYGGQLKSLEELKADMMKDFEKHRERFEKLLTLRVDESLRPTKLENDEILGYYGSFRSLNLD